MLRELLTKEQVREERPTWQPGGTQVRSRTHFNCETNCQVCNDTDHTTEAHYRSNRLCFTCFKPGHSRHSCPSGASGRDVGQGKLADLVLKYEDVFSRHNLDCGEAKEFVHRIRLTDERPFRLPYRRVLPAEYQKLPQVLNEMEEK